MSLLTDQEIQDIWNVASGYIPNCERHFAYASAIEAKVIEKIKAHGPVKAVAVMVSAVGSTYKTPAEDYYRLPEGEGNATD